MRKLIIKETFQTPYISFDCESGKMEIKGYSTSEDPKTFYDPLIEWMKEFEKKPCDSVVVDIEITYYNTSSSKWLLELLAVLNNVYSEKNKEVLINWHYKDDEIFEAGKDYRSLLEIPFNFIKER